MLAFLLSRVSKFWPRHSRAIPNCRRNAHDLPGDSLTFLRFITAEQLPAPSASLRQVRACASSPRSGIGNQGPSGKHLRIAVDSTQPVREKTDFPDRTHGDLFAGWPILFRLRALPVADTHIDRGRKARTRCCRQQSFTNMRMGIQGFHPLRRWRRRHTSPHTFIRGLRARGYTSRRMNGQLVVVNSTGPENVTVCMRNNPFLIAKATSERHSHRAQNKVHHQQQGLGLKDSAAICWSAI